jgi:adenylate cyclase
MKAFVRSWLRVNPVTLTLGVIVLVLLLFASRTPILDLVELKTYDLRVLSRAPVPSSPAVVLAVIDEKSLEREGRWPWPRSKIAALVDRLSRDGAKVIGFDIAFVEPDEHSLQPYIEQLTRELDAKSAMNARLAGVLEESRKHADNDLALATALKNSSAAVVLGYFFHESEASLGYRIAPEDIARRIARLGDSKYPFIQYETRDTSAAPFIDAYAPEPNLDILNRAAPSSGYFSLRPDPDGMLRWMPLAIRGGDDVFPPLAILSAWHYLGKPRLAVKVGVHGMTGVQMGERFVPTDENGRLLINYLGPPKTFPHFPVTDVLRGELPAGTFKDKIVLIGATAVGTYDLKSTPVDAVYPGLEIHATVIDNILTGNYLARPEWSKIYDILAVIALAALIGVVLPRIGVLKGLGFAAALFAAYILAVYALFDQARIWLNIVYPLLALTLNYSTLGVYYYVTEQRERRKIQDTFKQYLTPAVMENMLKNPQHLHLGGEEKILTVLFCDLQGFTSYCERFTPAELVDTLSEYYDRMTEQVFESQGTLMEYTGDELMAMFGAPVDQADHARRACAAALAMRDRRRALSDEWAKAGRQPLRARTGINTGVMLVGNLGSRYRFKYGVLGDAVNLGSRLEGLNKTYRTEILIGEGTAELLDGAFHLREIDMVRATGKKQAVRVYELLAATGAPFPHQDRQLAEIYAAGLKAYRQQRWDAALDLFGQCLTLRAGDGPAQTMVDRCRIFRQAALPRDWDGIFEQLEKG